MKYFSEIRFYLYANELSFVVVELITGKEELVTGLLIKSVLENYFDIIIIMGNNRQNSGGNSKSASSPI